MCIFLVYENEPKAEAEKRGTQECECLYAGTRNFLKWWSNELFEGALEA